MPPHVDTPLPDQQQDALSAEQVKAGNRISGQTPEGPIDTEAEVVGVELGGLALDGPTKQFGVVGSDVADSFSAAAAKVTDKFDKVDITDTVSSYISQIDKGELPTKSLNERLTGRRRQDGYIIDSSGQFVLDDSRQPFKEKRGVVTSEQAKLISVVNAEREASEKIATDAEKSLLTVADTTSYLTQAIKGKLPTKSLNERLTGRRRQDGYIVDPSGQFVLDESGQPFKEKRTPISSEQAELVISISTQIDTLYNAIPKEIQENTIKTLSTKNIELASAEVKKQRGESLLPADIERFDKVLSNLEKLRSLVARVELTQQFSMALVQGPEQATALLDATTLGSAADRDFIQTFLRPAVVSALLSRSALVLLEDPVTADTVLDLPSKLVDVPGQQGTDAKTLVAYGLRRLLLQDYQAIFSGVSLDELNYQERIKLVQMLPVRASLGDFDYIGERAKLVSQATETLVLARSAEIRSAFADKAVGVNELVASILDIPQSTPEDTALQEELLESLATYLLARRKERPQDFSALFSEITEQVRGRLMPEYPSIELGRNLEAAKTLARNFKDVIAPIFQSLRGDERTSGVEQYISAKRGFGKGRQSYTIDTDRLLGQRQLTDIETDYLRSVEALSIFNPHLTALASEAPAATQVLLESHFEQLSDQTKEGLQDGAYFPMILVGLGPNGVTALGEVMRLNPQLATGVLAVDSGELPGGPFAIPKGAAWDLNSANERGSEEPTLPDSPEVISGRTGAPEDRTVRAYGSPLPWYPGERAGNGDTRPGSINTTVDYLPTPDDLSDRRYPTNDELALVLQLQAAMLLSNVALTTEVVNIVPNPDTTAQGNKLVTLRMTGPDGQSVREVTVATDAVVIASGLGKPSYGFDLQGSKAQKVLQATVDQPANEFPILSDTLTAFKALADREQEVKILGDTLVVYGAGNSADTLVEYVGGLFADAENPSIRNVKKIIIVTKSDLSGRPRYARIRDLRGRNGQDNLVEFVDARVADVRLNPDGRTVVLLDPDGNEIKDKDGDVITSPSVIAATGFKSELDTVLGAYLGADQSIRNGDGIEPLTLPTNSNISVADFVADDPSIVLVGTASRADFENPAKILQLPREAAQALLRNGAENAVAIGFRRPDDQAAMRIFVGSNHSPPGTTTSTLIQKPRTIVDLKTTKADNAIQKGKEVVVSAVSAIGTLPAVRRDLQSDSIVLSPLFLQSFGRVQLQNSETMTLGLSVQKTTDQNGEEQITFSYDSGDAQTLPKELADRISTAISSPYFLAYWLNATSTRRVRDGLNVQLAFRSGKLDLKRTYVEPK